jgi:sulfur relay protein TusB/DsrH
MLFLFSSAPDTKEFKTAYKLAKDINAEICLLQNAVYAAGNADNQAHYALNDDLALRGIDKSTVTARVIDYSQLIDIMTGTDKVVGLF